MSTEINGLIFLVLISLPLPLNILLGIIGKYNSHDINLDDLMGIIFFSLVPGLNWLVFLTILQFLFPKDKESKENEQKRKQKLLLIKKEKRRKEYLAAYFKAKGYSIEDMDEWIDSLSLIDKFINKE